MDRIYRHQRHFYDVTRKFFLLGRDYLIDRMVETASTNILEVGCGTARNLLILKKKLPNANLFGLDISSQMLRTASKKCFRKGHNDITLRETPAEDYSAAETFNLPEGFDAIFFSYSLSMIPQWRKALQTAINNLAPTGKILIVDFYDQKHLPDFFAKTLKRWLSAFHVKFDPEIINYLRQIESNNQYEVKITPLYRRYAWFASITPKTKIFIQTQATTQMRHSH